MTLEYIPKEFPWVNPALYSSFSAAMTAATARGVGLLISSSVTISTPTTINVPIRRIDNGKFVKTGTGTVTFGAYPNLGTGQAFSGFAAGEIGLGTYFLEPVRPEWWGIDGVDDHIEIQAAIEALADTLTTMWGTPSRYAGGGIVLLGARVYNTTAPIVMYESITLQGMGKNTSRIVFVGTNSHVISLSQAHTDAYLPRMNIVLRDFGISCGGKTNIGIYSNDDYGLQSSYIERLAINDCREGIRLEGGWLNHILCNEITDCIVGITGITLDPTVALNNNMIIENRIQAYTRHGIFINGRSTFIFKNTMQVDAWVGTDAAPPNVNSHAFPVGLEIYGKDSVTLGLVHPSPQDNVADNNWFEVMIGVANATGIYLDGVTAIGGVYGPITTSLLRNSMSSSVAVHLNINAADRTFVENNSLSGVPKITLGTLSTNTKIYETYVSAANITDNSGGSYVLDYTIGNDRRLVGKLSFTAGGADAPDTNIYRHAASVLRTDDTIAPTARVVSLGSHSTFNSAHGNIHSINNTNAGSAINYNPTGTFPFMWIIVTETGGVRGLNFDSAGLNAAIAAGKTGVFCYDGVAWRGGQVN